MLRLPKDTAVCAKFAKLFREYSTYYQAAQIQGFTWEKTKYEVSAPEDHSGDEQMQGTEILHALPTREEYEILQQRYKELPKDPGPGTGPGDITFEIDPYLTEQNTGAIDGKPLPMFRVHNRVDAFLTEFILQGGMDMPEPPENLI